MQSTSSKGAVRAVIFSFFTLALTATAWAQAPLFERLGPPEFAALPDHVSAAQPVRVDRRALEAPSLALDLFGETVTAVRERLERHKAGERIWVGHLAGTPTDTVIVTVRGNQVSGFVQKGAQAWRIGLGRDGRNRLYELDLASLPPDDAADLPDGSAMDLGGDALAAAAATAGDTVVQDLLVVYTQGACNWSGGCAQLEADIATAVADLNTAYAASGIGITMNLVGTAFTDYTGTGASATLSALAGTSDGAMDEVHALRDALGADIVSLIYDGEGCGIGYLPASPSSAFNVTDVPCMVGNRTMAHEIGHNQGAHHDRVTARAGESSNYNYGYRRCNDGSVDDFGSPFFRTVLSYGCTSAPRVGRFSNPDVNYSGVPQGVDPNVEPTRGAHNARTLNERAAYVAGFRTASTPPTPPAAPSGLIAAPAGADAVDLSWVDNSDNEDSFTVQRAPAGGAFATVATLPPGTSFYTDDGLAPETAYDYRVRAANSAGVSAWSNEETVTTEALPDFVEDLAQADLPGTGSVSGSFADTHAADGVTQAIAEQSSGGPKRSRRQAYDHAWRFDVFGGAGGVILTVEAWVSGAEGANFAYSTDGGASYTPLFTVNATGPGDVKTFALPGATAGQVLVRVTDAESSNGEPEDTVFVDLLVITSYTTPGSPPATPSGMTVDGVTAGAVSLSFMDNAGDEFGFELWRAESAPAGCSDGTIVDTLDASPGTGTVSAADTTIAPETTYWYWATAFNGAGDGGLCSGAAQATTLAAPSTSLTATGYKDKGVKVVDLAWTGLGGATVDVLRDGEVIASPPNNGSWTHNTGEKGGGAYTYQVCEAGSQTLCTDAVNVVF